MKHVFDLTVENSELLNRVAKEKYATANDWVNAALVNAFLPVSAELNIESRYIFQKHENGYKADSPNEDVAKECISRGIRWLGKHPIQNASILELILARFPFGVEEDGEISTCNDYVRAEMDRVYDLLKERVPGYTKSKGGYDGLVVDIFANWVHLWQERVVYDVLQTIVYNHDPKQPFDWFDGLNALYSIDRAAWYQWCDAC